MFGWGWGGEASKVGGGGSSHPEGGWGTKRFGVVLT